MSEVDLHFKPSVPVFDANIAVGRRHDRRVSIGSTEGTLKAMDSAGIDRALVYTPHAIGYDSQEGNAYLMELVKGKAVSCPSSPATRHTTTWTPSLPPSNSTTSARCAWRPRSTTIRSSHGS